MSASVSIKTIERLSLYRRLLKNLHKAGRNSVYIYSHELALFAGITPSQVRRDLMHMPNLAGNPSKGYRVQNLLECIERSLGTTELPNIAICGVGNLGKALISYFRDKKEDVSVVAAFDVDKEKINREINGTFCWDLAEFKQKQNDLNIEIVILAVPDDTAQEVAVELVKLGISDFVNCTQVPLNLPEHVHIENLDIMLCVEKAAFKAFNRDKIAAHKDKK
ncbi:MAG: redox-sensing transcriptional repressor Rex [Bacteriovoracia bacterium]